MYRTYFRFDDEVGGFDSYAICCKKASRVPPPVEKPLLKCQTIENTGGSAGSAITANCPDGWTMSGGGFHDIDQNGGGSASDEFHSRPEGNGWYVRSVGWLGTAATGPPPLDF